MGNNKQRVEVYGIAWMKEKYEKVIKEALKDLPIYRAEVYLKGRD